MDLSKENELKMRLVGELKNLTKMQLLSGGRFSDKYIQGFEKACAIVASVMGFDIIT